MKQNLYLKETLNFNFTKKNETMETKSTKKSFNELSRTKKTILISNDSFSNTEIKDQWCEDKTQIENTENGSSLNILKDFKTTVSFDSLSVECSTKATFVESGITVIKEELKINTINEIKKNCSLENQSHLCM